jgi:hypothetical protein
MNITNTNPDNYNNSSNNQGDKVLMSFAEKSMNYRKSLDRINTDFNDILEDPEADKFLKTTAELGLKIDQGYGFKRPYSLEAKETVMKTLTSQKNELSPSILAEVTCKIAENIDDEASKKATLEQGLRVIKDAPDISENEKEIAQLGYTVSSYCDDHEVASEAMLTSLNNISSKDNDSFKTRITDVTLESIDRISGETNNSYGNEIILKHGVFAIERSKLATEEQKELISYGQKLTVKPVGYVSTHQIRIKAMEEASEYDGGSTAPRIARISTLAADIVDPYYKESSLTTGFEVIESSKHSTHREKELAKLGQRLGRQTIDIDNKIEKQLQVMEEIINPGSTDESEITFGINRGTTYPEDYNIRQPVIVKNDCVLINGVKLEKKKSYHVT